VLTFMQLQALSTGSETQNRVSARSRRDLRLVWVSVQKSPVLLAY